VPIPAWVLDPRTPADEAWGWLEELYVTDTGAWFEAFTALCSAPRYTAGD
jgi:hypothetical protein